MSRDGDGARTNSLAERRRVVRTVVAAEPSLGTSLVAIDVTATTGPAEPVGTTPRERVLGRNLSALASGQVLTWLMTGMYTAIVPRVIGPHQMGLLTAAWSTAGLFGAILGLGTKNYLSREIAARPRDGSGLLGTGMLLRAGTIPIFFAAAFAYGRFTHLAADQTVVLYLATFAISLTFPTEALQAYFQGVERMKYLAYGDVLSKAIQALAGVSIAFIGLGAAGVSLGAAGAFAVVLGLSLSWARGLGRITYRPSAAAMKDLLAGSFRYWVLGLFLVIYLWIDTVMLSRMAPDNVVAWYGAATRLFQALMFAPTVVVTAWLPRMVAASERDRLSLYRASRAPILWVIVLGPLVAVGTAMTAGPVVHIIFGSAYAGAVTPLVILGMSVPLVYVNTVMANVFIAAKRPLAWSWVMVIASLLNPFLNFWLIRYFQAHHHNGAIGASISLLLTELTITLVGVILVGRKLVDGPLLLRIARLSGAAAAMWATTYSLRDRDVVIQGFCGTAVYCLAVLALRVLPREELEAVLGRLPRPWSRAVARVRRTRLPRNDDAARKAR